MLAALAFSIMGIFNIQSDLPHEGTLKCENGFVYVDLDDETIHKVAPELLEKGFEESPYYNGSSLAGAHITVIYPDEMERIKTFEEEGKSVFFQPVRCEIVHPPRWEEGAFAFLAIVEAPELDSIREKYGLEKLPFDFHITLGVKAPHGLGQTIPVPSSF